jgi:hypothetical protein
MNASAIAPRTPLAGDVVLERDLAQRVEELAVELVFLAVETLGQLDLIAFGLVGNADRLANAAISSGLASAPGILTRPLSRSAFWLSRAIFTRLSRSLTLVPLSQSRLDASSPSPASALTPFAQAKSRSAAGGSAPADRSRRIRGGRICQPAPPDRHRRADRQRRLRRHRRRRSSKCSDRANPIVPRPSAAVAVLASNPPLSPSIVHLHKTRDLHRVELQKIDQPQHDLAPRLDSQHSSRSIAPCDRA